jgi:hypothetical protein
LGENLQTSDGTSAKKKNCALARGLFHDPDASLGLIAFDRLLSVADSWLLYFLAYKAAFLSRIFYHHSPFSRKTTLFILAYCLRKILVQAIEIFKRGIGDRRN